MMCIHELEADWCATCLGIDDPTIPSPEPSHQSSITQERTHSSV